MYGDCIDRMSELDDHCVDLVIADPPYGRTKNKWDSVIPMDLMWDRLLRVTKSNTAILLFADGMYMADLMHSNKKLWRYNLVWDKVLTSGFLNAGRMPLRQTEEICVFYGKLPTYVPQFTQGAPLHGMGSKFRTHRNSNNNYNSFNSDSNPSANRAGDTNKYPTNLLKFSRSPSSKMVHPTEKPVSLLKWLINTYSNEGDVVLDFCMGSGSTGVACKETNRNFIGIEKDRDTFIGARNRIRGFR